MGIFNNFPTTKHPTSLKSVISNSGCLKIKLSNFYHQSKQEQISQWMPKDGTAALFRYELQLRKRFKSHRNSLSY